MKKQSRTKLVVIAFVPLLCACITLRDLSTDFTELGLQVAPAEVLSIGFVYREEASGLPPHGWFGYINNTFSILTFGMLWPLPVDVRVLPAPPLWASGSDPISDTFDAELTAALTRRVSGSAPTVTPPADQSIDELRALARRAGKRYLYLVRINLYRSFKSYESYGRYSVTRSFSGFIPSGSRMLVDVESGKRVVVRDRPGEKYIWWLFLSNGFSNDYSNGFFQANVEGERYGRKVGALSRTAAYAKYAQYVYDLDIAPNAAGGKGR